MKIAFFEIQGWEKPFFKDGFKDQEVKMFEEPLDSKRTAKIKDFEIVSVFIDSCVDKSVISALSDLRLVATRSTGYDHIDLEACRQRGILISNVPNYGENTVAEHTFGLILSISRNIPDSYQRTRQGDFACSTPQGFDLRGKTIGVLGTGRIGKTVIEIAKGFGMEVLAYDKFPNHNAATALDFSYTDIEKLLANSDIVTLHMPLTEETKHFLNKEKLDIIKKGAVVINTARGGLIETKSLTDALRSGKLYAAGLDVLEEETLVKEEAQLIIDNVPREELATVLRNHILLTLKNAVITPHCAFSSKESLERLANSTIENINSFIEGNPKNLVS
jgi:D-lactate dehydrogenase